MEQRVLVHTPRGRDADVVQAVLSIRGIPTVVCRAQDDLFAALADGAAAAIVTEEAFGAGLGVRLHQWLMQQPSWSDFPFIVLTSRQATQRSGRTAAFLQGLGNVVLLERPVNTETLASAADAAVRGRDRQYATRQHLQLIGDARAQVERLNRELEGRISSRTRELAAANDRLTAEIAERERAQAALVQAQKMEAIGRLTGGIAHDFNNLLHVVSMNLDLLARVAPDPKVATIAAQAKRAVARGSRLTTQLLAFSRAQSLVPRLTDINALLLGMQELVAVSAGSTVRLELALSEGAALVSLDASQLEMAVLNLAVNAKDAMAGGGTLTVSTRVSDACEDLRPGRYVVVTVADTGLGIPAHLLNKVFDPFFTTKPVGSGTGLGLSQVYGFARQSGGIARIRSEIGRGTEVEMWFPVAPSEIALPAAPREVEPPASVAVQQRILVIEDDADVRRVIVEGLQVAGHEVMAAADGVDGLMVLQRQRPDVMIVDYAMPAMNGAEVIDKAREFAPGLPVILATGYADMAEVGRVLGTQSILIKPFDMSALLQAVERATQAQGV